MPLKGIRSSIAAPFYLIVSPIISLVAAYLAAVVVGFAAGSSADELIIWRGALSDRWPDVFLVAAAGLSAGLATGVLSLVAARPAYGSDNAEAWRARAVRSIALAAVGGVLFCVVALAMRANVGQGAAIALVAVLLVATAAWTLFTITPRRGLITGKSQEQIFKDRIATPRN